MRKEKKEMMYKVAIGYGENVQTIDEFQAAGTIEAESAEAAAADIFNGLEPENAVGAIFQVRPEDDTEYEYFSF